MQGSDQLGAFLRSRRLRLDPKALGVTMTRRRRTPGLRREEVAERAGISPEWYIKLEQGRAVSPSEQVVEALGHALVLNEDEQRHLRRLTERRLERPHQSECVPDALLSVIASLNQPAYLTGERWDVLAWNDPADALLGFANIPADDRNIMLMMFARPESRALFGDRWADEAKRMLALFRVTYDNRAGDPAFETLRQRLGALSPDFVNWWETHEVGTPASGCKRLEPPGQRPLEYSYATFQSNDNPSLKLCLYHLSMS